MKNNILRVCLLVCLFVNAFAYAEDDGGSSGVDFGEVPTENTDVQEGDGTGQEFGIAESIPVNSNMYILAAAGVIVGAYFFNKKQLVKA